MIRTTTQAIMNLSSLPAPFYPGIAQPNGSLIGATNNTTSSASSTNGSGGCKANVVNISHRFHFNNNNNAQTTMTFNPTTTTTNNNNHKTNTSNNNHIDCHSNNHHIDMDIESDDDNIITVDDADVGPSKPKRAKIDSDQHIAVATNHNGHHIISRKFPEEISERAEFSRQCLEKSDEDLENNSQNYDDEGDSDDDDGEEEEEDDDNLEGNSDDVYDNDSGSPVVQDSNRNPPVNRNSGTHSTPPPPSLSVSSSPSKLLSSISSPPSSLSPASHVSVLLSQPASSSSSSTQSSPSLSPQSSKIAVNKQLFIKLEIEEDSNSNPTPNHKNTTNPTLNHPDISSVSSTVASRFITHGIKPSSLESTNPHLPSHSSSSTSHSQREHPSPNSFSINSVETPPQSPQTPPSCISTTSSPHNLNTPSSSSSFHHSPLNLSSSCLELKTSSPKTSQENLLTQAILASSSSPSSIPSSSPEHHQHHLSPTHNQRQITAMYPYCDSNPNPNHHPNSLQRHSTQSPPTTSMPKSTRSSMSPDSHKPTKKTNFSIDAILSSNFGNENKMDDDDIDVTDDGFHGNRNVNNTADNRSSTEYNDNDNNNVDEIITNEHQNTIRPRGLEPPAIKSTHSAFTTVMDLSLKTKIVPHLTPPHAPPPLQPPAPSSEQSLPQHQIPTIPTVVAPTATPPSPPLSSPSSSSTSSLQRSFCRTPQDDDENTTTSPTSTNNPHHHHNNYENFKLLSPNKSDLLKTFPMYNPLDPSTFNPNTHNLEKQFPFLTQHPQFIYPFTPGSTAISTNQPILKNPSLFIERHFPMFYNTFTQTPGKFPPFYNPHIQNSNFPPELHNTPHNRQPIIKPEYKIPDNLAQNITFNPASFHQPRPNTNQHPKRKPQQNSLPSDLIFQRNTPSHPHTSPILADISSPGSNTDSHQSFYTKYSMDIKEKLNSILENISPPPPHSKRDTSSFHEHKQLPTNPKRESKFPEKSGNTSHKQQPTPGSNCKPETIKNNFRLDGSQNGHVGNVPKRSKSMTRDPSDRDVVRQQNGSKNNKESEKKGENPLLPAWVFCTRYSDRPSSGPRSRKPKRKPDQEEKRPRTAFTNDQLMRLRREFDDCRYLTETRRQSLANELGLSESQIKIWFQNKRAKIKKSVGVKNPLALQLMKQGLYNHATMKSDDDEEEIMAQ